MSNYKAVMGCLLAGCCLLLPASCQKPVNQLDKYFAGLPFEMPSIRPPKFPGYTVNITDFGARPNGDFNNATAINRAIQTCAQAGGGKVIIPAGIWHTGPIVLKSNINLHLNKDAILLFSGKFEDYPLIETSWEGVPGVRCTSPVSGKDLENIAITGKGIIDGAGDNWRPVLRSETTRAQWQELVQSGGVVRAGYGTRVWWPSAGAANGKELVAFLDNSPEATLSDYAGAREYLRPVLISLIGCKNVLLDGPTFQNSPAWNIHPLLCENVIIRNITVRNPWYSVNGDGLDIESCKNVLVYNATFDVGDDAICIKSGKNEFGRKRGVPSENIIITNCTVYHGHGGVTIGSEMSGGVRNVAVKDCRFMGTEVGLRFKTTRGRGGIVENIFIKDVLMKSIKTDAIRFNMFYDNKAASLDDYKENVDNQTNVSITEETPRFRKIHIDNVVCYNAGRAVFLRGLPEMAIRNIAIANTYISSTYGVLAMDAEGVSFEDVIIKSADTPKYTLHNSRNIQISHNDRIEFTRLFLQLSGRRTENIRLAGFEKVTIGQLVKIGREVKEGALVY